MADRNITIYFMSGTGNSFRVASWIREYCTKYPDVSAAVIPIEKGNPELEIEESPDDMLGIVMPTHAFTAPWHVIRYVLSLPRRNVRAFCVATRAGLKIGPLFTPGVSGSGTFLIAMILALKGYRVAGVTSIDMPCNWIALHPSLSASAVDSIIARAKPKAEKFIMRIFSGERVWWSLTNLYELILGALLMPVTLMFLVAGRFYLSKLFFANNDCSGCGLCSENCPTNAIRMPGGRKRRPYWRFRCESCMRCMAFCPRKAIEAGHSWAVILAFITSIPVAVYLFEWMISAFPQASAFDNYLTREVVSLAYLYLSLFVSYLIFNILVQIPAINGAFTWTTLTHFYKRYREPETDVKDLV